MVARDLLLVEETGGRYHLAHMSTARAAGLVREAKRRGLPVTCEVTPHHLLLTDRAVVEAGFDAQFKMNPPLRADRDREALLAALADGTVDAIASDHAPHTSDEKCFEFELAPFGILGLETTLSVCLEHLVRPGHPRAGEADRAADLRAGARARPAGRHARPGLAGGRDGHRPRAQVDDRAAELPQQVAQHAVRRLAGDRRRRRDHRRRPVVFRLPAPLRRLRRIR